MQQKYKICPDCTRAAQLEALVCQRCGHEFDREYQETEEDIRVRENAARARRQALKQKLVRAYLALMRMRLGSVILFIDCLVLRAPAIVVVVAFFMMVGVLVKGIKFRETTGAHGVSLRDIEATTRPRTRSEAVAAAIVTAVVTALLIVLRATSHHVP